MIRAARGYTLVEVLVAVTVFAILSASAYVALDGLSDAAFVHRERSAAFADLQLAVTRLDNDLRQLATRPVRTGAGPQPALAGEELRLVATRSGWGNPSGQPRSSLQRFAWQMTDGRLERTTWPVTDRATEGGAFTEAVLDEVIGLRFRYLDDGMQWRTAWPRPGQEPETLPRALSVELETRRFGRIERLVVLDP